jgi:hypothetical protein
MANAKKNAVIELSQQFSLCYCDERFLQRSSLPDGWKRLLRPEKSIQGSQRQRRVTPTVPRATR